MAIAAAELKRMQRDIAALKKDVALLKRKNGRRRVVTRKKAAIRAPSVVERQPKEALTSVEVARRAGLLAELTPEEKARAERWHALPEEEKKRIWDEFFNLKLDKQLSDIIIENRR
jgi:hypothetical protein